jgi:hypothetical protein
MRMGRDRLAIFLLLGILVATCAGAQAIPTVALENGVELGYNLSTNNVGSAFRISMCIGLTDKLQGEFSFISGDGVNFQSYGLLELAYEIVPRIGATVSMGTQTTGGGPFAVAGMGIYANLFGRSGQGSLQTGLRLRVDYLAPATAFQSGLIRMGVAANLGM